MTDVGTRAIVEKFRRWVWSLDGAIAAVGILALVVGLVVNTTPVWVVCGVGFAAALGYALLGSRLRGKTWRGNGQNREEAYQQSPEGDMKRLLFDDFQSSDGDYVVKVEEEVPAVVPSTKQAQPAPLPLATESFRELELVDFFDLDVDASIAEAEPRAEFHSLMNKVLIVLKDILFAHTVAFYWVNREKQQMVPEAWASGSSSFARERFSFGEDLLSGVALSGKPRLIGRVEDGAEADLLKYYSEANGVRSVVAVPVFFKNGNTDIQTIGVVVADSPAEDVFGQETLLTLGRFTKLVSALLKSYTDKYDLLIEAELLSSLRRLQDRAKASPSEESVLGALVEEANRMARWDFLTITMYSEESRGWVVQKVVNKSGGTYAVSGQPVDLRSSIVAESIRTNTVQNIADLTIAGLSRFAPGEPGDAVGSMLCIPISSFNRCYGALAIERREPNAFAGHEEDALYRLVESAAAALEVLYMNDLVREYVVIDHHTGSMTKRHFLKRVEDEVSRAEEFGNELAMVSFAVDGLEEHTARYGRESAEPILNEVTKVLRASMRSYDAVGRQDADRLAVILVNTTASDAYLWAEKMRKQIAAHVIEWNGKSFSVTVSIGVCGLSNGMNSEDLFSGTARVLLKAVEGGGNLVRVY